MVKPSTTNAMPLQTVRLVKIDEASEGQRVDNFLLKTLKGVPKSHVYRILRSGEVRLNKKRVSADARLALGDVVRIPPIRLANAQPKPDTPIATKYQLSVVYEDAALLVIDKPAGIAVHGGSGISLGVIEQLRQERPKAKYLELVHRLDRETSGVLMVAKKRSALVALHQLIRDNKTDKRYFVLVKGIWPDPKRKVTLDLQKYTLPNGERRVNVVTDVKKDRFNQRQSSSTIFRLVTQYKQTPFGDYSLLEAQLITGRTHQLRVQLAHLGYPIVGDDKYGDFALNKQLVKQGLKRMFLHSAVTCLKHPLEETPLKLEAPLSNELATFVQKLEQTQQA